MLWVSDVIASQSVLVKRKGCLDRIPSANTSSLFPDSSQLLAMSSSNAAASSSAAYDLTLGNWAWGATDPSENWEVRLSAPCLGYHPGNDTNEDNVLLRLDQSYDDHRDVVPLPGKMEYPSFSEVGMVRSSR